MPRMRIPLPLLLAGLLLLATASGVHAGEPSAQATEARWREVGAPVIRNFRSIEYGASVQNWAVVQDPRGVIYVANAEDGVLEYDGARWRRIVSDNRTTVRSLAVAADGRVYVGAVGELGYLAPDERGQMQYVSLLERVPPGDRDFADVWRTFATSSGVYFSSFKRLIRIDGNTVRIWPATSRYHLAFEVRDRIYVREVGRGLLRLVGDELQPMPMGERFADERIYAMLPWTDGSLLIGTRTQGWFIHDGHALRPWTTEADGEVNRDMLYGARWLQDGTLAVATLQGGVYLLDRTGALLGRIDETAGLNDQTIYDMAQDRQGGLWLAMDKGIARVEIGSPLSMFNERSGLEGNVVALLRHDGRLYAGTTQGLYRLDVLPHGGERFVGVPEVRGQTWAVIEHDDALLIANAAGVFEIRGGRVRLVHPMEQVALSLQPSARNPDRVYVGTLNGVESMRRDKDRWVSEGLIAGVTDEARTMVEDADGALWLGTISTGVIRLTPLSPGHDAARPAFRIDRFGMDHGLPRSQNFVFTVNGSPLFATERGIYLFDAAAGRFVADRRFESLFAGPRKVSLVMGDGRDRFWMNTSDDRLAVKETGVAAVDAEGVFRWDVRYLRQVASNVISSMWMDDDGVMWFGGDDGVYRYDEHRFMDYTQPFSALVREVSGRDASTLFGGTGAASVPRLPYKDNVLRFEFAAPGFGIRPTRFQVFLEGVDEGWTPWTTGTYRDYTNLREGDYRFRVRAMNPYDEVSGEGVYEFTVLPPWYRTSPAYAMYLLLAAGLFAGIWRWRSATLNARNHELAHLVALRTEELSSANRALQAANEALADISVTDALTGLRNRRYLVDTIGEDIAAAMRAAHEVQDGQPADTTHELLFVMVDIDHFKQVNDYYGHAAGDRVLEQFAAILRKACRDTDTPVRWGGEEFMIVARGAVRDAGPSLVERIRALTAAHIFQLEDGKILRRSCSVGFAVFPVCPGAPGRFTWEAAVEFADQCLYEAKRNGRNGWVGVRGTQQVPLLDDEIDFNDLKTAVDGGYLEIMRSHRSERRAVAV